MKLKKLLPIFALAASAVFVGCEPGQASPSVGSTSTQTETITNKALDGHEHGTVNFGVHYGPHYDFSSGEFKVGPSVGLGLDF